MKSLNFVYPKPRSVEVIYQDVPKPGPGEVLCKTTRSLLSIGTEMTCLNGEFDPDTNWYGWVKYPFLPGYSTAAVVLEAGEGTSLKRGDRVASEATHMQYFTCAETAEGLIKLPDKISDDMATWIPLCRVAQNAVRRVGVEMGSRVVVIGAGQVGQLVINFVRLCGATQIIVIDPIASRAALSVKSGATHTLSMRADEAIDAVSEITGTNMADIVIDSTGHPAVLSAACKLARKYGKIGLVGDCSVPSQQCLGPGVVNRFLSIVGAHGSMTAAADNPFYPWTFARVNNTTIEYMEQGRLELEHLITNRYSPMEAPEVYMKLLNDRSAGIGVMFEWDRLEETK